MIEEDYCSYEVAKLLKEKGFLKGVDLRLTQNLSFYDNIGLHHNLNKWYDSLIQDKIDFVVAPTHQMAMKWLREVHNICITIYPDKENGYEAVLYNIKDDVEIILQSFGIYGSHIFEDSYEEAVEAALKYSLENLI